MMESTGKIYSLTTLLFVGVSLLPWSTCFQSPPPISLRHQVFQPQLRPVSIVRNNARLKSYKIKNDVQKQKIFMVRNIDLPEAIVFYGQDSIFDTDSGDDKNLLPGVENLLDECTRDDAAVVAILENNNNDDGNRFKKALPSTIHIHLATQPPPNPRDVWEAIHSVNIQPKGFGGSSGFGSKAADPERNPLPKHVVVLCTTLEQCRAARYAGMRVLCLQDNDLADGIIDDDWETITLDDISTPGSFWLNPPHPRDDDSYSVDPEQVMIAYEEEKSETSSDDDDTSASASSVTENQGMMSDDELAAILLDIDPL